MCGRVAEGTWPLPSSPHVPLMPLARPSRPHHPPSLQIFHYKYCLTRVSDFSTALAAARRSSNATVTGALSYALDPVILPSNGTCMPTSDQPQCLLVTAMSITWRLCIVPEDGWNPSWMVPLQISMIFLCILVSGGWVFVCLWVGMCVCSSV